MPDVLNVEREKVLQESRRQNNMRPKQSDVLNVQAEKESKAAFANNEAKLQALAAAEKARREAAKPPSKGKPDLKRTSKSDAEAPPLTADLKRTSKSAADAPPLTGASAKPVASQPTDGKATETKTSQIVGIHPDGTFDLKLSSGEVIEKLDKSWLARLRIPSPTDEAAPPPSAGGLSRPGTGLSRPGTGSSRPPTAKQSAPPSTANSQLIDLSDSASAPVVNLDDTLAAMGRRGGRDTLGARRAAQSEISSLLSWD